MEEVRSILGAILTTSQVFGVAPLISDLPVAGPMDSSPDKALTTQLSSVLSEVLSKQLHALVPEALRLIQSTSMGVDQVRNVMHDNHTQLSGLQPVAALDQEFLQDVNDAGSKEVSTINPNSRNQSTDGRLHSQVLRRQNAVSYRQILSPVVGNTDGELNHNPDDDFNHNMVAQRKGEYLSIKVDEELVQRGVSTLQHSLIGRLTLAQGDSPYNLDSLKAKLNQVWEILGTWNLIPLGRGYYNIQFSYMGARDRVLDKRSWGLKPGIMRVQRWVKGYNP